MIRKPTIQYYHYYFFPWLTRSHNNDLNNQLQPVKAPNYYFSRLFLLMPQTSCPLQLRRYTLIMNAPTDPCSQTPISSYICLPLHNNFALLSVCQKLAIEGVTMWTTSAGGGDTMCTISVRVTMSTVSDYSASGGHKMHLTLQVTMCTKS